MDTSARSWQQSRTKIDIPGSKSPIQSPKETSKVNYNDKNPGGKKSNETGPAPFNRTRSFKTKQLVRSQAIRESQSPPRVPSPNVRSASVDDRPPMNTPSFKNSNVTSKPILVSASGDIKKLGATLNYSTDILECKNRNDAAPDNQTPYRDQKDDPHNNNVPADRCSVQCQSIEAYESQFERCDEKMTNSDEETDEMTKNKRIPLKNLKNGSSPVKSEFQTVEIQVTSGDSDAAKTFMPNYDDRSDESNKKDETTEKKFKIVESRRPIHPSKQDSGISCWDSCNCCGDISPETINSDAEDDCNKKHHVGCPEHQPDGDLPKFGGRKPNAMLTVQRSNSGGNRLLRKQSSGGSIDSGQHSAPSPYLSRDNSAEYMGPCEIPDINEFIKETLNKSSKDRQTLLKLESELLAFIKDSNRRDYKLPASSSYGRLLVHRCAQLFGLRHGPDSSNRTLVCIAKLPGSVQTYKAPPLCPFQQWCTTVFSPDPASANFNDNQPAKSILKRDAQSFDEEPSNINILPPKLQQTPRSKSFEQREEEYVKARRRIFNSSDQAGPEKPWIWDGTLLNEADAEASAQHPKILTPDKSNRLLKVHSLEYENVTTVNRGVVSKAHSFGGYGGKNLQRGDSVTSPNNPPQRILSRQGELASNSWRLSPCSSGYKTLSARDSVTPSPTSQYPNNKNPSSVSNNAAVSGVLWAITDMSTVPAGAIIIHPETGQALTNTDGSIYHFDPNKPLPAPLLPSTQNNAENIRVLSNPERRRSKLEKQRATVSPGTESDNSSESKTHNTSDPQECDKNVQPESTQKYEEPQMTSKTDSPVKDFNKEASKGVFAPAPNSFKDKYVEKNNNDIQNQNDVNSNRSKGTNLPSCTDVNNTVYYEPTDVISYDAQPQPYYAQTAPQYYGPIYDENNPEYLGYRPTDVVNQPIPHSQMIYTSQPENTIVPGFTATNEYCTAPILIHPQTHYRLHETDAQQTYQYIQSTEQPLMMGVGNKPQEVDMSQMTNYPVNYQPQLERTPSIAPSTILGVPTGQHTVGYQVPGNSNWGCWPQIVYTQHLAQTIDDGAQKYAIQPGSFIAPPVQENTTPVNPVISAIPQSYYQHGVVPTQPNYYVPYQTQILQPYPVYQHYPSQNVNQEDCMTPSFDTQFIWPKADSSRPNVRSPKAPNSRAASNSGSSRATPLNQADVNFVNVESAYSYAQAAYLPYQYPYPIQPENYPTPDRYRREDPPPFRHQSSVTFFERKPETVNPESNKNSPNLEPAAVDDRSTAECPIKKPDIPDKPPEPDSTPIHLKNDMKKGNYDNHIDKAIKHIQAKNHIINTVNKNLFPPWNMKENDQRNELNNLQVSFVKQLSLVSNSPDTNKPDVKPWQRNVGYNPKDFHNFPKNLNRQQKYPMNNERDKYGPNRSRERFAANQSQKNKPGIFANPIQGAALMDNSLSTWAIRTNININSAKTANATFNAPNLIQHQASITDRIESPGLSAVNNQNYKAKMSPLDACVAAAQQRYMDAVGIPIAQNALYPRPHALQNYAGGLGLIQTPSVQAQSTFLLRQVPNWPRRAPAPALFRPMAPMSGHIRDKSPRHQRPHGRNPYH